MEEVAGKGEIFVALVLALLGGKRKNEGKNGLWTRTCYLLQAASPMGNKRDAALSPAL